MIRDLSYKLIQKNSREFTGKVNNPLYSMFSLLLGKINFETTLDTVFHPRDWQRLRACYTLLDAHGLPAPCAQCPQRSTWAHPTEGTSAGLPKYQMNVTPKPQFQEYI